MNNEMTMEQALEVLKTTVATGHKQRKAKSVAEKCLEDMIKIYTYIKTTGDDELFQKLEEIYGLVEIEE